jgi:tRNA(Arg) A34 adenosine deaminase TadA
MDLIVMEEDHRFLRRAIDLARRALNLGHDPFGAVLVADGVVVHEGFDRSVEASDSTYHPELAVISEYCARNAGSLWMDIACIVVRNHA